jgi:hypothetical protein
MKYQFVADLCHEFPVTRMCQVLAVSTSGYYAWRGRPQSQRAQDNLELVDRIKKIHAESRGTYGSPRVHAELVDGQGIKCNKKRVERLMRIHDIRAKQRGRRRVQTTDSNHNLPIAPNLLNRQFEAQVPNQKWVADTLAPALQVQVSRTCPRIRVGFTWRSYWICSRAVSSAGRWTTRCALRW